MGHIVFTWVKVSERLPDEDATVLLYWGDHVPVDVGLWNGVTWQDANDDMGEFDADPTHWTSVPPPPA